MKIRPRKYASGAVGWQLDVGIVVEKDGKRRRQQISFPTKKDAEIHRDNLLKEKKDHGRAALGMSQADRLRYAAADVKLQSAGVSIEQAVEWALERSKAVTELLTIPEVVKRFIDSREELKLRERSVRQYRVSLGGFAAMYPEDRLVEVTKLMVTKWLKGNDWAGATQRNYLGDLRTCFSWARGERFMSHDPCEGIELPKEEEEEIQIFAPEQCERLLMTALNHRGRRYDRKEKKFVEDYIFRPLLGYGALATFNGVRPEEVKRTERKKVHPDEKTAVVTGKAAKTRQRRTVTLSDNCVAWIRLWMRLCPNMTMVIPKNFPKLWTALREAAGLKPPGWSPLRYKKNQGPSNIPPWPKDVLRHTAATMHYAKYQNLAQLQAMLGHHEDEDTLFKNYRAVEMPDGSPVTSSIADKFYVILPPADIAI